MSSISYHSYASSHEQEIYSPGSFSSFILTIDFVEIQCFWIIRIIEGIQKTTLHILVRLS